MKSKPENIDGRQGWMAFIDYADETNVFLHGLPPGMDFSSSNKNTSLQTPACYAAYIGKKVMAKSIVDAFGADSEIDEFGFTVEDYMASTSPMDMVQKGKEENDRLRFYIGLESAEAGNALDSGGLTKKNGLGDAK